MKKNNNNILSKKNVAKSLLLETLLFCSHTIIFAQNNKNSPYTRYGLGELTDYSSGKNKSMGGTAIGMRNKGSINMANPASYTSIDSMCFMFEVGMMGKVSNYTNSQNAQKTSFTGNIEFFNMQFPLGKWLAGSIGLTPYSYIGYDFPETGSIEVPNSADNGATYSTINFTKNFKGSGGLHQAYIGLAGRCGKYISIGVNAYLLFGSINHTRQITYDAAFGDFYSTLQNSKISIVDFNLRYGIQGHFPINKNHYLTIGAIAETKNRLSGKYTVETSGVDTISSKNGKDFYTPLSIGAGISYSYKNQLVVGVDAIWQNWEDAAFFSIQDTIQDRLRVTLGAEYTNDPYSKDYYKRMAFRLGANATCGYLDQLSKGVNQFGITFGLGFPARGNRTMINVGFEYGRMGNILGNQLTHSITENYFKFTINASFNEIWFFKRKFE